MAVCVLIPVLEVLRHRDAGKGFADLSSFAQRQTLLKEFNGHQSILDNLSAREA
jgi:hypothetical protein